MSRDDASASTAARRRRCACARFGDRCGGPGHGSRTSAAAAAPALRRTSCGSSPARASGSAPAIARAVVRRSVGSGCGRRGRVEIDRTACAPFLDGFGETRCLRKYSSTSSEGSSLSRAGGTCSGCSSRIGDPSSGSGTNGGAFFRITGASGSASTFAQKSGSLPRCVTDAVRFRFARGLLHRSQKARRSSKRFGDVAEACEAVALDLFCGLRPFDVGLAAEGGPRVVEHLGLGSGELIAQAFGCSFPFDI